MTTQTYRTLAKELQSLLSLSSPPLAIGFSREAPANVARYAGDMPAPSADGRTGKVSAGCVFWMRATEQTFTTTAEDHANCSVGSVTHGFKKLSEASGNADVAALLGAGWVTLEAFPKIPVVKERPGYVTYGPLQEASSAPDVVFLRINAKQAMVLSDALPNIRFEGKPQCHIIAIAKEHDAPAISVGCMLSRVRTGMPNTEMSCALPGARLAEIVEQVRQTVQADTHVAAYASEDARRFR